MQAHNSIWSGHRPMTSALASIKPLKFLSQLTATDASYLAQSNRAQCAAYGVGQQCCKQWRVNGVQDAAEGHQVNQAVEDGQRQAQGSISELPATHSKQEDRGEVYSFAAEAWGLAVGTTEP